MIRDWRAEPQQQEELKQKQTEKMKGKAQENNEGTSPQRKRQGKGTHSVRQEELIEHTST